MFRGYKQAPVSKVKWSRLLLISTMLLAIDPAYGQRSGRLSSGHTAPSQEAFYSSVDRTISDADLKRADELRVRTIQSIQALLDNQNTNDNRKFELFLRLGELYTERHDFMREMELRRYEQRHDRWLAGGSKGEEPTLNHRNSRAELTRAANSFRRLVTEYPRHPRTAAALYSLGNTLGRLGNENAVLYFQQLIRNHPNSELIPDAHLSLGEYYFEKHDMENAIENYRAMMRHREHRAYVYAVYKMGWAYYNATPKNQKESKDFIDRSVAAFKLTIRISDRDKEQQGALNLRDEALRDLVVVWAETEAIDEAWSYFRTLGERERFYSMLEMLGGLYEEQGRTDQAIAVFKRLLKESPDRPNNPTIYATVAELNERANRVNRVVSNLEDMHKLYVLRSSWTVRNARDEDVVNKGRETVEKSLHRWGTTYHQVGQKAENKAHLAAAAKIYELYLESFAEEENAYNVRYYLADILFEFERYEPAARHFVIVARAKPEGGEHTKLAAYNAVLALNREDQRQKYPALPPAGQVPQSIEIPRVKARLVEVVDTYVELLPREEDGYPMRYTAAQVYFDYGHYDEAIRRFARIVGEIPTTKQGEASLRVILAYFSTREDWARVIEWSKRFQSSERVMAAGHEKLVTDSLRTAMFQRSLALERDKKYADAAAGFLGYQSEFPRDQNADRALYNASLNFYRLGQVEDALAAGRRILDDYPRSEFTADVLVLSAETYESLAQFDQAGAYYRRFATSFPNDNRAPAGLFNAAVLYKGLHRFDVAAELFERFVASHGRHEKVAEAHWEVADIREREGSNSAAIAAYDRYTKQLPRNATEQRLLGEAKVAELTTLHGNRRQGITQINQIRTRLIADNAPRAFDARRVVARTLFQIQEPTFASFQQMQITNPAQIEAQVQAKQGQLVANAQAYENIIAIANPEYTVASLHRLGEMHENFSQSLFQAPSPRGASQVDIDRFRTEIEKVAFPLREEAYNFYEAAYRRSAEVETFTVWTRRTYDKMVELANERHPEVLEESADPTYMSHRLTWDQQLRALAD